MVQRIDPEPIPDYEGPGETAAIGIPCPGCRGRGRKFTALRRMVGAGGGASETDLLKRTQSECLDCTGSGQAAA
jgi:hypothetical protein